MLRLVRALGPAISGVFLKHFLSMFDPATVLVYSSNIVLAMCFWKNYVTGNGEKNTGMPINHPLEEEDPFLDLSEGSNDLYWRIGATKNAYSSSTLNFYNTCKTALQNGYHRYLGRRERRLGFLILILLVSYSGVRFHQATVDLQTIRLVLSAVLYITSYTTVVTMFVLRSLPLLAYRLLRKLGDTRIVDVYIFRLSLLFACMGCLAIGLSPNRGVFILAIGLQLLCAGTRDTFKSLLISLFAREHITEFYGVCSLLEYLTRVLDRRIWAGVLVVALKQDDFRMGLPFWISTGIGLLALPLMQTLACCVNNRLATVLRTQRMPLRGF